MAVIRVIAIALALASATVWSSPHPSELGPNRYGTREDKLQLLSEATDRHAEVIKSTPNPDLQVGCGEGNIQHLERGKKKSRAVKALEARRRRSYNSWSKRMSYYSNPYPSINVWKPPLYPISRPYYIPVLGYPGRPPIYYPPQPLPGYNPGVPQENPYRGPPYLPPDVESTTMTVENRFNGGDNVDDRPKWSVDGVTQRPATSTAVIPTRRTRRPGVPVTHPPIVHNPTDPESGPQRPQRPQESEKEAPAPPSSQSRPPARPNEPSRCVWAIISCCSTSGQISYDCFEQRGCPGAFWDNSPCESEFAKAAISAALNYYEAK